MPYDTRITDIAKIAAAAAGKNARCAPQLLFADITFTLADAVEDGRLILGALRDSDGSPKGGNGEAGAVHDSAGLQASPSPCIASIPGVSNNG